MVKAVSYKEPYRILGPYTQKEANFVSRNYRDKGYRAVIRQWSPSRRTQLAVDIFIKKGQKKPRTDKTAKRKYPYELHVPTKDGMLVFPCKNLKEARQRKSEVGKSIGRKSLSYRWADILKAGDLSHSIK